MNAERMVHYDWRRHSPHRETRVVGDGLDRDRKRAFLVDKAFGFVLRKHERPRMLAYLVRSIEGEFRRFVGVFGVLGKLASRHDEAVESCHVDGSSAKVAPGRAEHLDLQGDVGAGVDLRRRRPAERHAGWMPLRLVVCALGVLLLAREFVHLRQRNRGLGEPCNRPKSLLRNRGSAGFRCRQVPKKGLGNPSPFLAEPCRSSDLDAL